MARKYFYRRYISNPIPKKYKWQPRHRTILELLDQYGRLDTYQIQALLPWQLKRIYLSLDTLFVNVTGSFALGLFITLAFQRVTVPAEFRGIVAVGFLGGYTTFSALSFEAVRLAESGELLRAGASLAGNVVIGLLAAYLGIIAARSL